MRLTWQQHSILQTQDSNQYPPHNQTWTWVQQEDNLHLQDNLTKLNTCQKSSRKTVYAIQG